MKLDREKLRATAKLVLSSPRTPLLTLPVLLFVVAPMVVFGANGCPIALDLNGDGVINTNGLNTSKNKIANLLMPFSNVSFDLDGSGGNLEKVEWLRGDGDGFLLDMRNIDLTKPLSGHDLFGTAGGFEDGFEKIRELDTDGNGVISGDELSDVAIWQDDGDAVFETNELKNLSDFGIYSISVVPVEVPGKDNQPLLASKALSDRGGIYVEDVWLLDTENIWTPSEYFMLAKDRISGFFQTLT